MTKLDLNEMTRPIARDLEAFDARLDSYLATDSKLINSVIRHIMASRGKRLRPALVFLSSRGGGYYSSKLIDSVFGGFKPHIGVVDPIGVDLELGSGLYLELLENLALGIAECINH